MKPTLVDQIKGKQMQDEELVNEVHKIINGEIGENFSITQDGVLTMKGRVCAPNVENLRKLIMEKVHCLAYAMRITGFRIQCKLCQIRISGSHLDSSQNFKKLWLLPYTSTSLSTHKPMINLKGPSKLWKTCSRHVCLSLKIAG